MTRKPAAFRLDDPHVVVADEETHAARGMVRVVPQPENFDLPVPVAPPLAARRRFPWGTLFWSALGGLTVLGAGLATTALIEDLYARATWLGTLGAALAALAGLSLLVLCVREIVGLLRLASIEKLRARAELALVQDDRDAAIALVLRKQVPEALERRPVGRRSRHADRHGLREPLPHQANRYDLGREDPR